VPTPRTYDYAIVRVVPRVERGEFVNAGVILSCAATGFLKARFELDLELLAAMAPGFDLQPIHDALAAVESICVGGANAGAIGRLSVRERFHWLVSPRSTSVQTSPVHSGQCHDLDAALEELLRKMVRRS
jgi:hypothetical protein